MKRQIETRPPEPGYPIRINASPRKLQELSEEEYGSWEDHGHPEPGEDSRVDGEWYGGEHALNICSRRPFEIRNSWEADLIIRHVLDNSIDKAQCHLEWGSSMDRSEWMQTIGWLKWLRWLQGKIRSEMPKEEQTED